MVRATLAGLKTQTRRIVTPHPVRSLPHTETIYPEDGLEPYDIHHPLGWRWRNGFAADTAGGVPALLRYQSPYGDKGDRLWVKETWACSSEFDHLKPRDIPVGSRIYYAADGYAGNARLRPSIFMMRWMSRVTLEITDVRAERLQDISEEDAFAEGIADLDGHFDDVDLCKRAKVMGIPATEARVTFAVLWDEINGERACWDSNPWVWVVSFRKLENP
jgi:hypothetical protein